MLSPDSVAFFENEFDLLNVGLLSLGARYSCVKIPYSTTSSTNTIGEKNLIYSTSSAITLTVWDLSDEEIVKSGGLLDMNTKRVVTTTSVTVNDKLKIGGVTYLVKGVTIRKFGSRSVYDITAVIAL